MKIGYLNIGLILEKKHGIHRGVIRPAVLSITWKHI